MNIKDFYDKNHFKEFLRKPFILDDYVIATNGQVLISVPKNNSHNFDELPSNEENEETEYIITTVRAFLSTLRSINFENEIPDPDITKWAKNSLVKCSDCKGTGHYESKVCPECDGEGELDLDSDCNTYTVDCKSCDGYGEIVNTECESICESCEGSGKVYATVELLGIKIQYQYAKLLVSEPDVKIQANENAKMIYFKSGSYMGIVMGVTS